MQFLLYAVIASFAWVSLLVISGYLAASGAHSVQRNLAQVSILSWIFLAITGAVITWALKKQIKEGRKELESE
jgi:membrane protein DedA with SNARE-associated domain